MFQNRYLLPRTQRQNQLKLVSESPKSATAKIVPLNDNIAKR